MEKQSVFIAIDLKSFYASVECRERRRDPLTTNLVVADKSRTEKTICLAVSPSLKSFGISGRARLFDVVLHHYKLTRFSNKRFCDIPQNEFYTITNLQGSQTRQTVHKNRVWFYTITNLQGSQTLMLMEFQKQQFYTITNLQGSQTFY